MSKCACCVHNLSSEAEQLHSAQTGSNSLALIILTFLFVALVCCRFNSSQSLLTFLVLHTCAANLNLGALCRGLPRHKQQLASMCSHPARQQDSSYGWKRPKPANQVQRDTYCQQHE